MVLFWLNQVNLGEHLPLFPPFWSFAPTLIRLSMRARISQIVIHAHMLTLGGGLNLAPKAGGSWGPVVDSP
jgi:hypothetical protein